jgi:hypothetical protein
MLSELGSPISVTGSVSIITRNATAPRHVHPAPSPSPPHTAVTAALLADATHPNGTAPAHRARVTGRPPVSLAWPAPSGNGGAGRRASPCLRLPPSRKLLRAGFRSGQDGCCCVRCPRPERNPRERQRSRRARARARLATERCGCGAESATPTGQPFREQGSRVRAKGIGSLRYATGTGCATLLSCRSPGACPRVVSSLDGRTGRTPR